MRDSGGGERRLVALSEPPVEPEPREESLDDVVAGMDGRADLVRPLLTIAMATRVAALTRSLAYPASVNVGTHPVLAGQAA